MRALLLTTFLIVVPVSSQTLAEAIDAVLETPAARRGVWGIHAIDLATGKTLYERNASVPMTPASNTKLVSTALALTALGPEHRFRTRVLVPRSPDKNGRVTGDLVLEGGGDPTISARAIPYRKGPVEGDPFLGLRELASKVAACGVKRIDGDVVGDDSAYVWQPYGDGWTIDDATWEYGAPVSALTLNDNAVQLTIRAPKQAGELVSVSLSPATEYFTIQNRVGVRAGAKREVEIDRPAGTRIILLTGVTPPGSAASSTLLAIDDPALYAAHVFRQLLEEAGIEVVGQAIARHRPVGVAYRSLEGVVVAERVSPPLVETLRVIDKISQNLHAELVLREVARVRGGDGRIDIAQEQVKSFLTEIGVTADEASLFDGSGLSRRGLLAPSALTKLLVFMHNSPHRDAFWSLLPIAAEDGSLERRFRGAQGAGSIRAKTGSLSHVNALSGYAGLDPNRRIAFSIIANHTLASSFEIRNLIDKIGLAVLTEGQR